MITVYNAHPGKSIPFGNGVTFHPGNVTIKDPEKLKHLKKNRVAFERYLKSPIPGTREKVLSIVSGSLDDKKTGTKKTDKKDVSPFADKSAEEALDLLDLTLDVPTLEQVVEFDTRKTVKEKAAAQLAEVRS